MPKKRFSRLRDMTKYTTLAEESTEVSEDLETEVIMPKWSGTVVVEDLVTGDGRLIERDALTWTATEDDPQLIRYVQEDVGAHDGAQVVGRIYGFERQDNGHIVAHGDFDMGSAIGREAFRQVSQKLTRGVSVDLDEVSFEIRLVEEVFEDLYGEITGDLEDMPEPEKDDEGRVIIAKMDNDEELFVTTSARIRAATLVATPAFSDAYIEITDYGSFADTESYELEYSAKTDTTKALTAAAGPHQPPAAWFSNPNLTGPTPLTITDEGRIYGHVATWDTCHIADPAGDGQCVTAPYSMTDYAYFHTGAVIADDGQEYAVGHITMNTGHARPADSSSAAMSHYDNTGTVVADVRAGEDSHGIWFSGAMRPSVSDENVRALRSAPLSGDWRRIGGNLEMVAALAVNVPGFPIPRTQGLVASGATTSLLAAGVIPPGQVPSGEVAAQFSKEDADRLQRIIDHSRKQERTALLARVAESKTKMAKHKVESFVKKRKKG